MTITMSKTEVIRAVIDVAEATPIVFTTGYASRIAHAVAPATKPLLTNPHENTLKQIVIFSPPGPEAGMRRWPAT